MMAADLRTISVLCPTGHRVTVKRAGNESVLSILHEVCRKKGYDPNQMALRHHKTILDTSRTLHLANLPNHGQLELIPVQEKAGSQSGGSVKVCLQVDGADRLILDLPSHSTLAQMLQDAGQRGNIQLPPESEGLQPVMMYLRRDIVGWDQLKSTTLLDLGLAKGSAAIRLSFKKPESLHDQAHVYNLLQSKPAAIPDSEAAHRDEPQTALHSHVEAGTPHDPQPPPPEPEPPLPPQPSKDVEMATLEQTSNPELPSGPISNPQDEIMAPLTPAAAEMKCSSGPATPPGSHVDQMMTDADEEEEEKLHYIESGLVAFTIGDGASARAKIDAALDDDFFELTTSDIAKMQSDLRQQVKQLCQAEVPLMTQQMRQAQKEGRKLALLNAFPKSVIRIQFQDLYVIQSVFPSGSRIGDVMDVIRRCLRSPQPDFHLMIPPNLKMDANWTLLDADCVPTTLFRIVLADKTIRPFGADLLRPDVLDKLSNVKGADRAAQDPAIWRRSSRTLDQAGVVDSANAKRRPTPLSPHHDLPSASTSRPKEPERQPDASKNAPKWFRMNKN